MSATRSHRLIGADDRLLCGFLLSAVLFETVFFVVLSPLLPSYARELHLDRAGAAILSAGYSFGYGVFSIPAGALAERVGYRRMTLSGLTLIVLSCTTFGIGHDAVLLVGARVATGVGGATVWAGSLPWLLALGDAADRGRLIGLAFSATSVGSCLGPIVGALATVTGPGAAFIGLAAVIAALAAAGAGLGRGRDVSRRPAEPGALLRGVRAPAAGRALVTAALPTLGFGVIGVLMPLRLHGLGVPEVLIAAIYFVVALLEVAINPRVGAWYDRRGGRAVLVALLGACAVGAAGLALPLPAAALAVVMILALPMIAAVWVPALAQLSAAVAGVGGGAGIALGLFNVTWAIVQVIGAIGGAELARAGVAVPFLALVVLFAGGVRLARGADAGAPSRR